LVAVASAAAAAAPRSHDRGFAARSDATASQRQSAPNCALTVSVAIQRA